MFAESAYQSLARYPYHEYIKPQRNVILQKELFQKQRKKKNQRFLTLLNLLIFELSKECSKHTLTRC